jgi:hypothetical protein
MGLALVMVAMLVGCKPADAPGDKQTPPATTDSQQAAAAASPNAKVASDDPAGVVYQFLEGIRKGDDNSASQLMSTVAREKIGQQGLQIAPQGSDTAKFEVGKVEYVAEGGARVAATWTDYNENRQLDTKNMLWVVRKDPEGWRIMGLAAEVFPGEAPLLLDFEKPEEMMKKLEWLQEEYRRRAEAGTVQAQKPQNSSEAVQR